MPKDSGHQFSFKVDDTDRRLLDQDQPEVLVP